MTLGEGCGYLALLQAVCNAWKYPMTRLSVHTHERERERREEKGNVERE